MMKLGEKVEKTPADLGLTKTEEKIEVPGKSGIKAFVYEHPITKIQYVYMQGGCFPIQEEIEEVKNTLTPELLEKYQPQQTVEDNILIEGKVEAKHFQKPSETTALRTLHTTSNEMLVDVAQAKKQWQNYIDLTKELLVDSDYQEIGNKKFKKKSAWRKYARFFNIADRIVDERIKRDEKGNVLEAIYIVEAQAPNGRTAQGIGMASKNEPKKFFSKDHDIIATAMTRAKSRAISDLIGAGETSAEEVDD
jgi:hypothetical protein